MLDKILFYVINNVCKALRVKMVWSGATKAGDIGDYTNVDEATELVADSNPASLRVNVYAEIVNAAAAPAMEVGEVVIWKDTVSGKYYIVAQVAVATQKSIELV